MDDPQPDQFRPRSRLGALVSLRHRDFRFIVAGQLATWMANSMQMVAISWHVYELTGSALQLGLVAAARALPFIAMTTVGGSVADIVDRKRIIFTTMLTLSLMALLLSVATGTDTAVLVVIYVVALVSGTVQAFESPARQSMVPRLVPRHELSGALTIMTVIRQVSMIVGPAVAGLVIGQLGQTVAYSVVAACLLVGVTTVIPLRSMPPVRSTSREPFLTRMLGGFTYLRRDRLIWPLMLIDLSETLLAGARVLMPIYASDVLRIGPEGLGLLMAAPAMGAVAGSGILVARGGISPDPRVVVGCAMAFAGLTIVFGVSTVVWLSLGALFLMGVADVFSEVTRSTIIQLRISDEVRGRVTAVQLMVAQGGPRLSEVKGGLLAAAIGPVGAVVLGGVLSLLVTGAIATRAELRRPPAEAVAVSPPAREAHS